MKKITLNKGLTYIVIFVFIIAFVYYILEYVVLNEGTRHFGEKVLLGITLLGAIVPLGLGLYLYFTGKIIREEDAIEKMIKFYDKNVRGFNNFLINYVDREIMKYSDLEALLAAYVFRNEPEQLKRMFKINVNRMCSLFKIGLKPNPTKNINHLVECITMTNQYKLINN